MFSRKKILIIFTAFCLLLTGMLNPTSGYASENSDRTNINFITINERNFEYTYEENGETFKVVETIDKNFKSASSKIYKQNDDEEFELYQEKLSTVLNNDTLEIVTVENGSATTEVFELNQLVEVKLAEEHIQEGYVPQDDWVNHWIFWGTLQYSDAIKKLTAAAIAIVIGIRYPKAPINWITQLANSAYQILAETLYYTEWIYNRYNGHQLIAQKKNVYVYSDSRRTNQIGNAVEIIDER